jgi:hypothetical protein
MAAVAFGLSMNDPSEHWAGHHDLRAKTTSTTRYRMDLTASAPFIA